MEKSTYYALNDKHFWAPFLNLARHNVYIILNHINDRIGFDQFDNDSRIVATDNNGCSVEECWCKEFSIEQSARLRDLIVKHFPFITAAAYEQEKRRQKKTDASRKSTDREEREMVQSETYSLISLKQALFLFLHKLEQFRNFYSHYQHPESSTLPVFEDDLLKQLYSIYDMSIRRVKDDYKHNPQMQPNIHFNHLIRLTKDGAITKQNPDFQHYAFEKNGEVTEAGLLFFVSLFLEKKDSVWMQKKIKGFKGSQDMSQKMTCEVFCRTRILLPKLRLESIYSNDQLLLDMLNELVRCPKSLYERLQEDDRQKFIVPDDQLTADGSSDGDGADPYKNKLVRHQNRFPYFALRYFDTKEVFDELRFQIDLGTYHFSIYKKNIGGVNESRHLTRNLYGFDRIQCFDRQHRPQHWADKVKDLGYYEASEEPFVTETTPHYHIVKENIGIKFGNDGDERWPQLNTGTTCNGRSRYASGSQFTADAFLSVHELTPMLFYYFLLKDKNTTGLTIGKAVENVLCAARDKIYSIYDAFADGRINSIECLEQTVGDSGLLMGNMPKQMIDILRKPEAESSAMAEQAAAKINKLKAETSSMIKALEVQLGKKIKLGKPMGRLLKPGAIASWLVSDMMRFQPVASDEHGNPLNNSKANSTEYRLLQRVLALFSSEHHRLGAYFMQMNLIGSSNAHPFLSAFGWNTQTNLLGFYHAYLKARKRYLDTLKANQWEQYRHFLHLKQRHTDRKILVDGWKRGFNLPRGLFTEPIRQWFENQSGRHSGYVAVKGFKRVGFVAKAIPLYFNTKYDDNVQSFYRFNFNVGNRLKPLAGNYPDEKQRKELWQKEKAAACVSKDFQSWRKFERELRLTRNQDILVWLMCIDMADMVPDLRTQQLFLKELNPDAGAEGSLNVLNNKVEMKLPIRVKGNDKAANHTEWIFVQELGTKLLKRGNFKALVKDRRLSELVSFVDSGGCNTEEHPIAKRRLEYELSIYQNMRVDVFECVLRIEEMLYRKDPKFGTITRFSSIINTWVRMQEGYSKNNPRVKFLITMRNACAHNQYPMYEESVFGEIKKYNLLSDNVEEKNGLNIARQLGAKMKEITSELISKI